MPKKVHSEHEEIATTSEAQETSGSKKSIDKEFVAQIVIIAILALLLVYNYGKLGGSDSGGIGTGNVISTVSASEILPTGIPKVYGKELGVSYDDVSPNNPSKADATIGVLGNLDNSITLSGADMDRYIKIASQISCEYCCGAESIIFSNGQAACGCAHSYAMRGLAKYLITKHGTEYTDDQILEELGKWKVLFFPGVHETKAAVLKSQGIELNYINLASNKYRGIEKGQQSSGSMVGGC